MCLVPGVLAVLMHHFPPPSSIYSELSPPGLGQLPSKTSLVLASDRTILPVRNYSSKNHRKNEVAAVTNT